uniref:CSON005269 protein n=1 Tax=Culicoides sonorensis TaxID=179676 RepID=A0A336LJ29_CULSO
MFKQMSLIDRKKLQWKREKDEMAKLEQIYSQQNYEMTNVSIDLTRSYHDCDISYQRNISSDKQFKNYSNLNQEQFIKRRNPILPPIDRGALQQSEDSGFTSDELHPSSGNSGENIIKTPQSNSGSQRQGRTIKNQIFHDSEITSNMSKSYGERSISPESTRSILSYPQSISNHDVKEERAKWNLYDPYYKDLNSRNTSDGPNWLERSIKDCEVESIDSFSFARGQNTPVDVSVLAAREQKRKKALELQNAIKQQLEERELMKQYQREKQLMEEKIEEQRLLKQLEEEQERLELERKIQQTRKDNELKKQELMRKAIEKATLEAKIEKEKKKGRSFNISSHINEEITSQKTCQPNSNLTLSEENLNNVTNENDLNSEKILIGTPIKMKKKDLKYFKSKNQNISEASEQLSKEVYTEPSDKKESKNYIQEATDIDGISLQMQSLIPVVPLQFGSNFFGITPQGNFNNVQLLMIAQPTTMLTSSALQNPLSLQQNFITNLSSLSPEQTDLVMQRSVESKEKSLSPTPSHNTIETKRSESRSPEENIINQTHESLCNIQNNNKDFDNLKTKNHDLSNDGTFIKETSSDTKHDAATSTNDDLSSNVFSLENQMHGKIKSLHQYNLRKATSEIGIQTELNCEYCQYKCFSENKPNRLRSQSSSKIHNIHQRQKYEEELTMTTTTTTTVVKKEKKYDSIQDRPKWGVRVPTVQYLKASEKDPFYKKKRNRRYLKTSRSVDHSKIDESSSSETFPLSPSSHHSILPQKKEYSSRNICTEVLPIKTDGNGKVYFIRERSFIIDQQMNSKPGLQGIVHDKKLNRRPSVQGESYFSDKNEDFDSIENSRTSSVDYN